MAPLVPNSSEEQWPVSRGEQVPLGEECPHNLRIPDYR